MKSSPFESFADFTAATGAIHTFANSPVFIYVCLGLTVLIGAVLVVSTYKTKH